MANVDQHPNAISVLGTIHAKGGQLIYDSQLLGFGVSSDARMLWDATWQTNDTLVLGIDGGSANQGGALLIVENTNVAQNYAHPIYTDPTLILHSATAAATDTGEFLELGYGRVMAGTLSSDQATSDLVITGEDAYQEAAANLTGSDLILAGGLGRKIVTIIDWEQVGDTITVTVNGSATALVENTDFNAETDNNTSATNLATAIDAISGVSASATAAVVYVKPDASTYSLVLAESGVLATVTNSGDGQILLQPRAAASPNLTVAGNTNTGIRLSGASDNFQIYLGGTLVVNTSGSNWVWRDNIKTFWGNSVDAYLEWDTGQTNDALVMGIEGGSANQGGALLMVEASNGAGDYALAVKTNPTLAIYSATAAATAVDEAILLSHNVTNGEIETLSGDLDIVCPANQTLELQTSVFDDIAIGASSLEKGAAAPDLVGFLAAGGLKILGFDGNATEESLHGIFEMTHKYKEGTDITPHIHWTPTTAGGGNVVWQFEYSWINVDGTFGAITTITVTDATDSTAWKHLNATFSAITGSGKTIDSIMKFRIFRDPANGSDTYADDAGLLDVGCHFEVDTIGSRQITTK